MAAARGHSVVSFSHFLPRPELHRTHPSALADRLGVRVRVRLGLGLGWLTLTLTLTLTLALTLARRRRRLAAARRAGSP